MTKRVLAFVLVLALTLSLLPLSLVSADSATTVTASPKAGTHTDAGHADDCGVTDGWQAWTSDNSLPTSGNWYLTKDVTLTADHNTIDGELNLCLNGYVIKQTGKARVMSTKDMSGAKLVISDCTAYTENDVYYAGAITGGNDQTANTGGGCIFVRKSTELHIYDGRFVGNRSQYAGGCILTQAAGTVSGVSYPAAKLFIYGGEFADNQVIKGTTTGQGGCIFLNGTCPLEITGGYFHDNKGSNGGVIYGSSTTVKIENATFTGNTATGSGSVLHNNGGMQLTIKDTTITGNIGTSSSAANLGFSAAVNMAGSAGKLTVSGKVIIADNTTVLDTTASLNFNKAVSDTLYVNELTAGSRIEFSTSHIETVDPAASDVVAINGAQTDWNNGWVAHLGKDGVLRHIGKDSTGFIFVEGHFHDGVEYLPLTSADQLIAGGHYYLDGDVTLDKAVALTGTTETSICLNGKTLTSSATSEAPFSTKNNADAATFNIDDCTAYTDASGVYHAGAINGLQNKHTGHGGGAFMIRTNGTLNFYNGKITNCTAVVGGGAIFANGAVNLYGGEISGNQAVSGDAAKNGGAIYVNYNASNANLRGTLVAENVIFKNNATPYGEGGAVYCGGPTQFKNCQFIENEGGKSGGALRVGYSTTLTNCVFEGNEGGEGGAIRSGSPVTATNCTFTGNTAAKTGGVIHIGGGNATFDGCEMTGNSANAAAAINFSTSSATLTIKDTTITGNNATAGYGAVNVIKGVKPVVLKGVVVIENNTHGTAVKNFHVQKANETDAINATGLTAGSKIGITFENGRPVSTFSTASASNNKDFFFSDKDTLVVELNADNKLELVDGAVTPPPPTSTHNHNLCSETGCTDHTATISYEAWTDATKLPTSGNWYLDTDVTLSSEVNISAAGTVNLCLNGHKVTPSASFKGRAYSTTNAVATTINISNCSAVDAGFFGFENTATTGGAAIFVRPGGTLNAFDVTFKGNKASGGGGAILCTGTANLYDCDFIENEAVGTTRDGAAILNNYTTVDSVKYNGSISVYDCTFTGNIAGRHGGAISGPANTTLYVEDSVFTGNTAGSEAGAVRGVDATTTLKNVEITGNQAKVGGAMCFYGGKVTLENVKVTGNHATSGYGAFHMNRNNSGKNPIEVILKGEVIITGNTAGATSYANNLHMREYEAYVNATGLTGASKIGVTMQSARITNGFMNITENQNGVDNSQYFESDDAAWKVAFDEEVYLRPAFEHEHCVCGDLSCTDATHEKITYAAWTNATKLPSSGNYCLTTDVTVTSEVQIQTATTLNLCLNGHTITGYTGNGARAYSTTAKTETTINVADCTAKTVDGVYTAGKFTGFNNTHNNSGGAAIYIREGSHLNFYDGIIENCTAGSGGGAIYLHTADGTIYGGQFINNQAKLGDEFKTGGALFVYKSELTVYDAQISGNKASTGAGIYLADGSSILNLCDGTVITGNVATNNSAGVHAAYTAATTNISGNITITGNTTEAGKASNLRLATTGVINVTDLAATSRIGVTASARRAISRETQDYSQQFTSDDAKMVVIYKDNVLYMDSSSTHKHLLCIGATHSGCDHSIEQFDEWDDPNTLPTSGSWYLAVDVTLTGAQTRLENGTLNLCLNGHTVTASTSSGRVFYMTDGAVLNLTDCAGGGKLTGATKGAILTNQNGTDMAINMYGGNITENHAIGVGGALVLQGETDFNLYGGKISNNTASTKLFVDAEGNPLLDANNVQKYTTGNAGGVYMASKGTFNMYGGEISGNKTTNGKYLQADGTTKNTGGYGGGVYLGGVVANLYGGKICGNEGYLGGGVFISGTGSQLNLMGTEISGNHGGNAGGGLISQTHAVVNLISSEIKNNTCVGAGAGMYISTGTTLNMTGGSVTGNIGTDGTNYKSGAGMYLLASTANISGGLIANNKGYSGAAICMGTSGTRVSTLNLSGDYVISGNEAQGNGGAVFCTGNGAKITMTGGTITKNKSNNGGGIITQTGTTFEMSGGTISYNEVTASGGGVYISTNTTFKMTGGSIDHNKSKSSGGGLVGLRANVTLSGGTISYNTGSEGAGVKVNGGTVTFGSVRIIGNNSIGTLNKTTGKYTGGNGGGIVIGRAGYKKDGVQMYECPTIYVNSPYVAYNKANGAAGGMLVQSDGTKFYMYGGTFAYNEAPNSSGGGIYFSTKSRPNVYGGNIYGNKAKNAGGVYFLNTTGIFENVKIHDNETTSSSAGMIVTGKDTIIEAKNIEMYNNKANAASGAIAVQGYATMNLDGGKFYGNISKTAAGAIYFSTPGYGTWKNIEVYDNESLESYSGAMFVGQGSRLTIENGTFRDNKAASAFGGAIHNRGRLNLNNCKILNNECSDGNGGGISGANVSSTIMGQDGGIYIYDTIISGNKASEQGGGVYGHRGCPTYLENCTVTDNVAGMEGGGVYANGRCGLIDTTITGNRSGGEGFAVYFTASEYDTQSYSTGHKKVGGNIIIKDNDGGDMYLGEASAVAVVGGPIGEKAHIEVTLHSGVISEHLIGVYNYEGGNLIYTITAGDRSLTDPEPFTKKGTDAQTPADADAAVAAKTAEQKKSNENLMLYIGIGAVVVALLAVAVLIVVKKKKAGKPAEKTTK